MARLKRHQFQHCTTPAPPDASELREARRGLEVRPKAPARWFFLVTFFGHPKKVTRRRGEKPARRAEEWLARQGP